MTINDDFQKEEEGNQLALLLLNAGIRGLYAVTLSGYDGSRAWDAVAPGYGDMMTSRYEDIVASGYGDEVAPWYGIWWLLGMVMCGSLVWNMVAPGHGDVWLLGTTRGYDGFWI